MVGQDAFFDDRRGEGFDRREDRSFRLRMVGQDAFFDDRRGAGCDHGEDRSFPLRLQKRRRGVGDGAKIRFRRIDQRHDIERGDAGAEQAERFVFEPGRGHVRRARADHGP